MTDNSDTLIYGIDFTSAPRRQKPIVCVAASLKQDVLTIQSCEKWTSFAPFESFLASSGSWYAGMDFPFGQPRELIDEMSWGKTWADYVGKISAMTKAEFASTLEEFSRSRPVGRKHLFRRTDRIASACSPMMVYGVPVAKMFYEGASRLLSSNVSVLPCRPVRVKRIALETYPALVARRVIGRESYKSASADGKRRQARQRLVDAIVNGRLDATYEFNVTLPNGIRDQCVEDFTGDAVDAVSCCIQAAWASRQKDRGIPGNVDKTEGWIVDAPA